MRDLIVKIVRGATVYIPLFVIESQIPYKFSKL